MPNKTLLEKDPLYKKRQIEIIDKVLPFEKRHDLIKPAINFYCPNCVSEQTFNMVNDYNYEKSNFLNMVFHLVYNCAGCKKHLLHFFVYIFKVESESEEVEDKFYAQKIGQLPPWSIEMDKELEGLLGGKADLYKKGLVCESQSYGIGAFAYFRRVTEEIIDDLLSSISQVIDPKKKEEYNIALEKIKKEKVADKKIEIVKDLLPDSLCSGGLNPLKIIYSALSDGLHSKNDEDCIEKAEHIRSSLEFLINQVQRTKKDRERFQKAMNKLNK